MTTTSETGSSSTNATLDALAAGNRYPNLYDIEVSPSHTPGHWLLDVQAAFRDRSLPHGAPIRLYWQIGDSGEPEQWIKAGEWETRYLNGSPNLLDLRLVDTDEEPSRVRLQAISAVHDIYVEAVRIHASFMQEAHAGAVAMMAEACRRNSNQLDPGPGAVLHPGNAAAN